MNQLQYTGAMLSRLSLAACALLILSSTALARSPSDESSRARRFPVPPIRARAAVVLDADTGAVLAAKNPHLRLPMASTTKIMTAVVALQLGHLSDRITVPSGAFDYEWDATVMGLHAGQVVTLRDLLYGLLLPSGADAANTIAIHYGGSEAHFASLMNSEAATLGLHDTHYVNAHGLTASDHYTSAYDLAALGRFASGIPALMRIVSTKSYHWNGHILTNVNHVLFWYPGLDGIKPGYTNDAGICQVLDAQRHGRHVVVAILNTPDLDVDARNLLNFGLQDFSWAQSQLPGDSPSLLQTGQDTVGTYAYFPGSGHYVRGPFWSTYIADGGLAALGFPRTERLRENGDQVQYFQNGVLDLPPSGHVHRLALGITPLPTPGPSSSTITPVTPTPTPYEGTVTVATGTPKGIDGPPLSPPGTATAQPSPTTTPRAPGTASIFVPFQRLHHSFLGNPVSPEVTIHGYPTQIFAYGALLYDGSKHTTYFLPIGDRTLAARNFLPAYPGNAYPSEFPPVSVLQAIGWGAFSGTGTQTGGTRTSRDLRGLPRVTPRDRQWTE